VRARTDDCATTWRTPVPRSAPSSCIAGMACELGPSVVENGTQT
jgi:hypothetical protein